MLPNLVVIGSMKCGTTSMHIYLDSHPEINMAKHDEISFFCERNWRKGQEWYESHFVENAKIVGERSVNYTKYPLFKNVPERMHSLIPDAKLIYMVRDPISRIISHYRHRKTNGEETRTIEECLEDVRNSTLFHFSDYYMQLEHYLQYYDKSQILVICLEELNDVKEDRSACIRKVFRFLEVDENFWCDKFSKAFHKSDKKRRKNLVGRCLSKLRVHEYLRPIVPGFMENIYGVVAGKKVKPQEISDALRKKLVKEFKPGVEKLRELCQHDFKQWSL